MANGALASSFEFAVLTLHGA